MIATNNYPYLKLICFNNIIKNISLFFFLLVLVACGGPKEDKNVENKIEVEEIAETQIKVEEASKNDIAAELQANKDKWLSKNIKEYQIEMQKICYCDPDAVRMMIFQISNDEIKEVLYADTGEAVNPSYYNDSNTIEGLFALVEQALNEKPEDIIIAYDEEFGYIKQVTVDYKANLADDEFTFIVSNLRTNR